MILAQSFSFSEKVSLVGVSVGLGSFYLTQPVWTLFLFKSIWTRPHTAQCVQMDFTRTFQANTKCNNINHVWSHFYKILVVLKYHRRLWANIFDTDISSIPTLEWCIWHFWGYLCSYKCLCQRYWLKGVYGTSKLPKFYRTDFKHDLYCCTWRWLEMST